MKQADNIKICFIDFFAYSLFNPRSHIVFGGAQIQLYLLAKELAKDKKLSISFLTDNRQTTRQETFNHIKVYQFLRSPKIKGICGRFLNLLYMIPLISYFVFFIRLSIQLKKIDPDFFIQRAASAETGLIAVIARILRKKFIFMVAHQQDVNGDFIKKNGLKGKLYLLGLKLAAQIICQTKEQRFQLDKNLKHKSIVIPSGYPVKKQKTLNPAKKQVILWVARAESWKNPELFIDLAQQFPQEKFTMICPPAENNPAYFKIIKTKAALLPNLKFIPWVPFNQVDAFFKKSKLFISTSLSEGFPNTFIQAGQNMTPIISYQINPDKIIDKYQLGFCAHGSQSQMSKLIKKVLTNRGLQQRLSINAFNYMKQHHNLTTAAAKLTKFLLPDKSFSKNPVIA